jgi:hypothetical protein
MSENSEEDHQLNYRKRREDSLRQLLSGIVDKPSKEIVEELKRIWASAARPPIA